MKMSLGVPRPRDKALRDNIDQNYELLLLYYSNRSQSLVCCTSICSFARSLARTLAGVRRRAFALVCDDESIFHSLQRWLRMFYNRHNFHCENYNDEISNMPM